MLGREPALHVPAPGSASATLLYWKLKNSSSSCSSLKTSLNNTSDICSWFLACWHLYGPLPIIDLLGF